MIEESEQSERRRDSGRTIRLFLLAAIAVLALVFVVQNDNEVEVSFVFTKVDVALVWALVAALFLGFAAGWLTKSFRNRD